MFSSQHDFTSFIKKLIPYDDGSCIFENQLAASRIVRRHSVQVTVPTFQSYEVTKKTIEKLLAQKDAAVDILLVDNNSQDYVQLAQDFPQINYLVAKVNTGSGGAQCLGMHAAIFYGYETLICTDNDALLLSDDGLSKLLARLDPNNGIACVIPQNVENSMEPGEDRDVHYPVPFHYVCLSVDFLKRIEPMDYYYFFTRMMLHFHQRCCPMQPFAARVMFCIIMKSIRSRRSPRGINIFICAGW